MTRARVACALAALGVVATTAGQANATLLAARLSRALTVPGIAWRSTGALALDLETGALVFRRNGRVPLRPASNEKLVVALAALDRLGPRFRIPTRVFGEGSLDGSVWRGRLVLKGYGDPALGREDLAVLARRLEAAGVRRVTGGIVADETYFDARRTAPGWKPSFYRFECPPLSALVVNRARVAGRVVDDPALAAARLFRAAVVAEGIRIRPGVVRGRVEATAKRLAEVVSPRLSALVHRMDRESDNFVAEMLLKGLGAREHGRGTTAAGALVARAEALEERFGDEVVALAIHAANERRNWGRDDLR
ncbi:MAG: D-alanyl-D-alanine carboxypeptidase, partial [Actinomycetota bacterium]|nr:D-alanyl-D-alanine carboxypeptidase [Actinomycetota bacterium]